MVQCLLCDCVPQDNVKTFSLLKCIQNVLLQDFEFSYFPDNKYPSFFETVLIKYMGTGHLLYVLSWQEVEPYITPSPTGLSCPVGAFWSMADATLESTWAAAARRMEVKGTQPSEDRKKGNQIGTKIKLTGTSQGLSWPMPP